MGPKYESARRMRYSTGRPWYDIVRQSPVP